MQMLTFMLRLLWVALGLEQFLTRKSEEIYNFFFLHIIKVALKLYWPQVQDSNGQAFDLKL